MAVTLHTNYGDIKIEVFCDTSPLASEGGDPSGTGKGGESIWGGVFRDEFTQEHRHDRRGIVSMANNGADTNASQFFITYSPQPHLNNKYSIFGQVIDGFETLDAMEKVPVGKKNRPLADIAIESVTIHANPLAM